VYCRCAVVVCAAGLTLHLDNLKIYNPAALAKGAEYSGNVLVAEGATVGKGCLIGPDVSIGDGCVIGDGVRLSNCVVMRGVRIKDHSKVRGCYRSCCGPNMACVGA
jgi:mannose-1-phosphate guanylyltransferase